MVISRTVNSLLAAVLLCAAAAAAAAPGFIAGTKVTRGNSIAELTVRFACSVEYLDHMPDNSGDNLHIRLEPTSICSGVSPTVSRSREQHRPLDADAVKLQEIVYDGESAAGATLTLTFSETLRFDVLQRGTANELTIRLFLDPRPAETQREAGAGGVRVQRARRPEPGYAINLSSSRQPHAASEISRVAAPAGSSVFETEVVLGGVTWYRLRVGPFADADAARRALSDLQDRFPSAWIDRAAAADAPAAPATPRPVPAYEPSQALASVGLDQVDELMAEARRAMVDGEISRAVQVYTKVLRIPNHDRHAEALEYLALAREKNGQTAHAKAEYERYLSLYPDGDGAARVSQRLAALLATDRRNLSTAVPEMRTAASAAPPRRSNWRAQTFLSQYYRRDVNQFDEEEQIVSQSALYTDVNLDLRRRGSRFDFGTRLSAGHRNDFLPEDEGAGNQLRLSYAYLDLADAETGLRGRIGRQSRNSGGILGRFDGLNLGYLATDRVLLNAVVGHPVNAAADGIDSGRTFYGASVNYGPILENLEIGAFFIQQEIEGISDRQAVGTEFRFFGQNQSLWGVIDYDTSYSELSSAFLQGSWRFANRLTVHGSVDRRHSPYLSMYNAMIGQPVATFPELLVLFSEEEIRQFSLDRAPVAVAYTAGLSHSLSPRIQINADATRMTVETAPESGGIAALPRTTYALYSTNLVASSILLEGDVTLVGLRFSESDTSSVASVNLDSRLPIGRSWRINPRLRVDRRQIKADSSYEWLYTPGIRILFRRSQHYRIELEAGKRFSRREIPTADMDRESYFVNLGYQAFF